MLLSASREMDTMKIKLLYKNQIIAEEYYEEHGVLDSKLRAEKLVGIFLMMNIGTAHVNLVFYSSLYSNALNNFTERLPIPSVLWPLIMAIVIFSAVWLNRKKERWLGSHNEKR